MRRPPVEPVLGRRAEGRTHHDGDACPDRDRAGAVHQLVRTDQEQQHPPRCLLQRYRLPAVRTFRRPIGQLADLPQSQIKWNSGHRDDSNNSTAEFIHRQRPFMSHVHFTHVRPASTWASRRGNEIFKRRVQEPELQPAEREAGDEEVPRLNRLPHELHAVLRGRGFS